MRTSFTLPVPSESTIFHGLPATPLGDVSTSSILPTSTPSVALPLGTPSLPFRQRGDGAIVAGRSDDGLALKISSVTVATSLSTSLLPKVSTTSILPNVPYVEHPVERNNRRYEDHHAPSHTDDDITVSTTSMVDLPLTTVGQVTALTTKLPPTQPSVPHLTTSTSFPPLETGGLAVPLRRDDKQAATTPLFSITVHVHDTLTSTSTWDTDLPLETDGLDLPFKRVDEHNMPPGVTMPMGGPTTPGVISSISTPTLPPIVTSPADPKFPFGPKGFPWPKITTPSLPVTTPSLPVTTPTPLPSTSASPLPTPNLTCGCEQKCRGGNEFVDIFKCIESCALLCEADHAPHQTGAVVHSPMPANGGAK